tara:strand:- start:1431 stop:1646 length:216 start_codon:yes stop_codon:yes gene_type:complete
MKYILLLQICSSISSQCSNSYQKNEIFNSWYECGRQGYISAVQVLDEMGYVAVNNTKSQVRFTCKEVGKES